MWGLRSRGCASGLALPARGNLSKGTGACSFERKVHKDLIYTSHILCLRCPGCRMEPGSTWEFGALVLIPAKGSSNLSSPSPHRYANTGHPAVRYSAYVRQRPPLVLLCLLHLWDRRCAALGRAAEEQVFPRQEFGNVSTQKSPPRRPFSLCPGGRALVVWVLSLWGCSELSPVTSSSVSPASGSCSAQTPWSCPRFLRFWDSKPRCFLLAGS